MFAGNIGRAQSLETVIQAAREVRRRDVRWHIVGDGRELDNLQKICDELDL